MLTQVDAGVNKLRQELMDQQFEKQRLEFQLKGLVDANQKLFERCFQAEKDFNGAQLDYQKRRHQCDQLAREVALLESEVSEKQKQKDALDKQKLRLAEVHGDVDHIIRDINKAD